jgi:hypothetical protein
MFLTTSLVLGLFAMIASVNILFDRHDDRLHWADVSSAVVAVITLLLFGSQHMTGQSHLAKIEADKRSSTLVFIMSCQSCFHP